MVGCKLAESMNAVSSGIRANVCKLNNGPVAAREFRFIRIIIVHTYMIWFTSLSSVENE